MFRSVKAKLENKEKLKQACSTAISALQTTLRIAKDVVGDAAVPGLKAGISGLLFVLDVVKKTSQNAEDVERLSKQIESFNLVLGNSKSQGTISPLALDRINRLFTTSNAALEELRKMASRHALKRFVRCDDDTQLINGHIQTITWSMQTFMAEAALSIESALDEHAVRMEEHAVIIQDKIDDLHEAILDEHHPPHAIFAPFNCKDRARCLEGTRADILDQIFRWIGVSDSQPQSTLILGSQANAVAMNTTIFWINGSAGTGKTTIAFTVAEACRIFDILGASFFCSRDDANCSNPNMIFTTIAYQLGILNPSFRAEVTRAMRSNPDIGYTTPPYQLEELIIKPLRTLRNLFPPCIVVLDALDECKETGTTSIILSSLSRHVNELFPLKFLVTSRPENHITTVFRSSELNPVTQRYILHEVELGVVQNDIKHYLSTKLAATRESYHLENEWPSIADVHSLTRMSFGLFIFASTSVRFIEDRNYCDPKHQLGRLLCNAPTVTEDSSPDYNLDRLYGQVLNDAFPNISSHLSGRLKMILGTIILLRDPLSPLALERLLGVPSRTVGVTLQRLHSLIMVPDDDTQVIRTLHPSLFDFLTNPTRCLNPKYVVDPQTQHTLLACACLGAMKQLKRDVCGIRDPSLLNSEVGDLPTRVLTCIRPELQYACRHWAWHLENATFSDVLVDLVNKFCLKYLLYWIEALSVMGDVRNALLALDSAQRAIVRADRDMVDTKDLLYDCERFTLEFFGIISTSSLQIYHSALLFTPQESLMKKIYGRELDLPVKIHQGLDKTWSPCIRTMEGHGPEIKSVAFSPDGTRIVSGSARTIRLWDAVSGAHLNTLKGHSDKVTSVAFSPDGMRIVSGSWDHTVHLWDAVSGAHLNTLNGHSNCVLSVGFSPNGTRIVSGSRDNTVWLWDAISGVHLYTLKGHSDWITSVGFSSDSTRIVSGSHDQTVRLWDAVSGEHLNTLEGHSDSVNSVAFSPDGTRIVSGSTDDTVRLWDAVSSAHLSTLEESAFSVAFSPDGTLIVSGSIDNTIRLLDAVSGAHLNTLKGHSNWVLSVTFSPSGTRIVSGSCDNTVRLWDAARCAHLNLLQGHSNWVRSVAFSSDSTRSVYISNDRPVLWEPVGGIDLNTLERDFGCVWSVALSPSGTRMLSVFENIVWMWDAVSGTHLHTLDGHSDLIVSITFSPDGIRIVSGSEDTTIRLWDAVSGAHLNTLEGHSEPVLSVAFSPDGTCIVSGSEDTTVRLWDVVSGAHLDTLEGHSDWVMSVLFSPDGICVMSGSRDGVVIMWDAGSGEHLDTFEGHSTLVKSLAFSPNGTRIVSGSLDHTIRLWDALSGEHLNTLAGHSNTVNSVAFSPDGTRIVSGSCDDTVRLWDAVSGEHLRTLEGHSDQVLSVGFSPDGTRIMSGSSDTTFRLWDVVSGAHLDTFDPQFGSVESVARSYRLSSADRPNPTGPVFGYIKNGWVHSFSWGRRICWLPVSHRPKTSFDNGDSVRVSNDGDFVIIITENGRLVMLDFAYLDYSYY